jgi:predicted  nucleic acid-binding Zn-ribbon protein
MEARVARLEAIIPTLATKEDLVKLELKLEKTIRAEITAVQQEIGGVYREIGNLHKDMGNVHKDMGNLRGEIGNLRGDMGDLRGEMGNLRGEMGKIEKTVATLVLKAMIAMVTISTALSTFAFMFAGK